MLKFLDRRSKLDITIFNKSEFKVECYVNFNRMIDKLIIIIIIVNEAQSNISFPLKFFPILLLKCFKECFLEMPDSIIIDILFRTFARNNLSKKNKNYRFDNKI